MNQRQNPTNTNAKLVRRICDRVYIFVLVDVLQRIYTRRKFVNWREKTRNIEKEWSFLCFLSLLCLGSINDKDGKKEYAFLANEQLRRRITTIVPGRDFIFRVSLVTMTYYFIIFILKTERKIVRHRSVAEPEVYKTYHSTDRRIDHDTCVLFSFLWTTDICVLKTTIYITKQRAFFH